MPSMVIDEGSRSEWRLLDLSYESAFKNLALEEALACTKHPDTFLSTVRFWTNDLAAVLGRFQEASSELDLALCESRRVQVARRFTGGGAVFHDKGTLNVTIVTQPTPGLSVNELHQTYSQLIINALADLGLHCSFVPPNSILLDGKKVCGAAASLGSNYGLWHVSILVSTDIGLLEEVLTPSKTDVPTRFVRSQWKPVTSLRTALDGKVGLEEVRACLIESLEKGSKARLVSGKLSDGEENSLGALLSKYSSTQWNLHGNRCRTESKESVE